MTLIADYGKKHCFAACPTNVIKQGRCSCINRLRLGHDKTNKESENRDSDISVRTIIGLDHDYVPLKEI